MSYFIENSGVWSDVKSIECGFPQMLESNIIYQVDHKPSQQYNSHSGFSTAASNSNNNVASSSLVQGYNQICDILKNMSNFQSQFRTLQEDSIILRELESECFEDNSQPSKKSNDGPNPYSLSQIPQIQTQHAQSASANSVDLPKQNSNEMAQNPYSMGQQGQQIQNNPYFQQQNISIMQDFSQNNNGISQNKTNNNQSNNEQILVSTQLQDKYSSHQNQSFNQIPQQPIEKFQSDQRNQIQQPMTGGQKVQMLQHLININQVLKGERDKMSLLQLTDCINSIEFLTKNTFKVKINEILDEAQRLLIQQEMALQKQKQEQIERERREAEEQRLKQQKEQEERERQEEEQKRSKVEEEENKRREEQEKEMKELMIQSSECGLCREAINSVTHETNAHAFFSKNFYQYFQAKCGHYISKICLGNQYSQAFNDSLVHSENEFKEMLKKKKIQAHQFVCLQCKKQLEYEEVERENRDYLTHLRSKRPKFDCEICIVDYDLEEEGISMFDCDHKFCIGCLTSYIIQCINQNKFRYEDFKCPQDGCKAIINNYIVDRLIKTPENEMLYNRMIRMQLIHTTFKNEKIALCPGLLQRNKKTNEKSCLDQETITLLRLGTLPQLADDIELIGCPTFFSYNEKKVTEYQCNNCKYKSCLKGCEDYHYKGAIRGKNCSEFQKWKKQNSTLDKDIMAFFDKNTMCQCPKCKAVIIRNGGCNHMTCTMPNCGFEFCFKCSSKWLCWKHFHYF